MTKAQDGGRHVGAFGEVSNVSQLLSKVIFTILTASGNHHLCVSRNGREVVETTAVLQLSVHLDTNAYSAELLSPIATGTAAAAPAFCLCGQICRLRSASSTALYASEQAFACTIKDKMKMREGVEILHGYCPCMYFSTLLSAPVFINPQFWD